MLLEMEIMLMGMSLELESTCLARFKENDRRPHIPQHGAASQGKMFDISTHGVLQRVSTEVLISLNQSR